MYFDYDYRTIGEKSQYVVLDRLLYLMYNCISRCDDKSMYLIIPENLEV